MAVTIGRQAVAVATIVATVTVVNVATTAKGMLIRPFIQQSSWKQEYYILTIFLINFDF